MRKMQDGANKQKQTIKMLEKDNKETQVWCSTLQKEVQKERIAKEAYRTEMKWLREEMEDMRESLKNIREAKEEPSKS